MLDDLNLLTKDVLLELSNVCQVQRYSALQQINTKKDGMYLILSGGIQMEKRNQAQKKNSLLNVHATSSHNVGQHDRPESAHSVFSGDSSKSKRGRTKEDEDSNNQKKPEDEKAPLHEIDRNTTHNAPKLQNLLR